MWLIAGVITWTLILQGVPPTKFGRVKNVQNSARFVTTFDFDRKYVRNGSTYRKSETYLINYISSPIARKNLVNFGTTNQKVIGAYVETHPTGLFSETIFQRWPLKFLHALLAIVSCISSRTWGAGRPHVGLCPIFLFFFN